MSASNPMFPASRIADFRAYEKVRKSGRYNMFDPRARRETHLGEERYTFVMNNYAALKTQALAMIEEREK